MEEPNRFEAIRNNERNAFELLFRESYQPLTAYAFRLLLDLPLAENMVQDVFFKLWQKRGEIRVTGSLQHYLFRSVRNHCLNEMERSRIRNSYLNGQLELENEGEDYSRYFPEPDLLVRIENAIAALPEKRQEIFRLAREEGMKYKEIAEKQNISIKTVEAQMTLALKQLRESLKDFKHFVLFFLLSSKGIFGDSCHPVEQGVSGTGDSGFNVK